MRFWAVVALVSGGLFTGGAFFVAVERVSIWARLDVEAFATDFRRSIRKADPLQPILLSVCGIATIAFATTVDGASAILAFTCVLILSVILVVSLIVAEPMNSEFRRRAEGEVPSNAFELRRRWALLHRARTVAAVVAFACLATAVAVA